MTVKVVQDTVKMASSFFLFESSGEIRHVLSESSTISIFWNTQNNESCRGMWILKSVNCFL